VMSFKCASDRPLKNGYSCRTGATDGIMVALSHLAVIAGICFLLDFKLSRGIDADLTSDNAVAIAHTTGIGGVSDAVSKLAHQPLATLDPGVKWGPANRSAGER